MSLERNKLVVRRLVEEVINRGDLDAFDELVAPDYVELAEGEDPVGRDEYRGLIAATREALPDLELTIEGEVAEGDTVAIRFHRRGPIAGAPSLASR